MAQTAFPTRLLPAIPSSGLDGRQFGGNPALRLRCGDSRQGRSGKDHLAGGKEVFSDGSFQNDRVRRPSNVAQRVIAAMFDPVLEASA